MQDGVRAGLCEGEARALMPAGSVRVLPLAAEQDARALQALALWAQRYSPIVAVDGEDGLLIDSTGCERVFDGEERLLHRVVDDLHRLGIRARVAIAPTFACAWAVARFGQFPSPSGRAESNPTIVDEGKQRDAIRPLPIAALGLDAEIEAGLMEVGIERIGELFALPRAVLPSRFSSALLLRLDQALGQAIEVIEPVRLIEPSSVERQFDGPTTQLEAIELAMRGVLEEVCRQLRVEEAGVKRLIIELIRSDLPPVRLMFSFSHPSRDVRHLWSVVQPRMEKVQLGFGVEHIIMTAGRTSRLAHEQTRHWRADAEEPDATSRRAMGELVDTLETRLGRDHVLRGELVESHDPIAAARFRSIDASMRRPEAEITRHDRPSWLFERPRQVQVTSLVPDGPVMRVRHGNEPAREMVRTIGPERIGPQWWQGDRRTRDYFKVQEAGGRWWWLCRESGSGTWSVQGTWM